MIVYAVAHEKDLSYGSLRQRMGLLENSPSAFKAAQWAACALSA
jgi:hypothetical protein